MPRKSPGYIHIFEPDAPVKERDAFTCCHCNKIIIVRPGSGIRRGYCMSCDDLHCGKEACAVRCWPFEKKLLEMEGRKVLWQSFRQV